MGIRGVLKLAHDDWQAEAHLRGDVLEFSLVGEEQVIEAMKMHIFENEIRLEPQDDRGYRSRNDPRWYSDPIGIMELLYIGEIASPDEPTDYCCDSNEIDWVKEGL